MLELIIVAGVLGGGYAWWRKRPKQVSVPLGQTVSVPKGSTITFTPPLGFVFASPPVANASGILLATGGVGVFAANSPGNASVTAGLLQGATPSIGTSGVTVY